MERLTKRRIDDGEAYLACVELREDECDGQCTICWRAGEAVDKLAAYEDTEFSTDASIKLAAQALGTTPERLRELAAADKEGRVAVLPFTSGRTLLCDDNIDGLRLMKDVRLAIRYCSSIGIVFYMGYDVFCDLVKHGRITAVSEEAERAMEGRKNG